MWGFSGNRTWVYPQSVQGRFQRYHRLSGWALLAGLVVVPWIPVAGHPAVHVDLPGRRLVVLGQVFTAVDSFNLVLVALLAAFSLFFFTSLLGRLWCGYACPQTVFLEELIRPIERWVEGDRNERLKRDQKGVQWSTTARKAVKLSLFGLLALAVSGSVMAWFATPWALWTGQAGSSEYLLTGIIAAGLFLDWAWFREQLCNYLCPYARFQGALTDDYSLVIGFDRARGEPRQKGKAAAQEGRCVDCNKCVTVCPQGIDIRDGYQLECVNCARCVDACSEVMGKLGHPSLVRYTTVAEEQGRKNRWIRPRTVAYAALLTALLAGLGARVAFHRPFEVQVHRAPGTLFQVDADGAVRNTFLVRLVNNDVSDARTLKVTIDGLPGAEVIAPEVTLQPSQEQTLPLVVRLPSASAERTMSFQVQVSDGERHYQTQTTFKAPADGGETRG